MGPHLKKKLWDWSLVVGGIIITACAAYEKEHHAINSSGAIVLIVGIFGLVVCVTGTVLEMASNNEEADLAWRWFRLLGNEEFPRDAEERNAFRQRAYDALEPLAVEASDLFFDRDQAANTKDETKPTEFPQVKNGEELRQGREMRKRSKEKIARITKNHLRLKANADSAHKLYIKHWKLFEDLGMIPLKPGKDELFGNPEEFRAFVWGDSPKGKNSSAAEPGATITLNMPSDQS